MQDSFNDWGIHKDDLVMMLRDNASNAVKACNDWQVKHFGCIGHTLHLIVGSLFVQRKSSSNDDTNADDDNDDDCTGYADDDALLNDDTVDYDDDNLRMH